MGLIFWIYGFDLRFVGFIFWIYGFDLGFVGLIRGFVSSCR